MGRAVVLGNGELFVGLDRNGLVHDFYYPYVGLDNLTNARSCQHHIGVWTDGTFSWVNDGTWETTTRMDGEMLLGHVTYTHASLGIKISTRDFVDSQDNVLIRRLHITNTSDKPQEVRLFMHQVFQISRDGRADTALYVPDDSYILDYKGRCALIAAGKKSNGDTFDQHAVGNYGIEGKDGTFKDAEDGELSGNNVEHGGVDSVMRFSLQLDPGQSDDVDYWIVAAESQGDAQVIHTRLKYHDIDERELATRQHFTDWLKPAGKHLEPMPHDLREAVIQSLLVIKAHADKGGSIIASGDSTIFNYGRDYYCYCWPRDAAYAIWPLIRVGIYGEAKRFFMFARDTLHRDGYLMHKYQPDRSIGSTWHPLVHGRSKELAIQEDETASVVFMLGQYLDASGDIDFVKDMYESFIVPAAQFMTGYVDDATGLPHASYDLWEQKFLTSTYSVSTVIAGLKVAADIAKALGHDIQSETWLIRMKSMQEHLSQLFEDSTNAYIKGQLWSEEGTQRDTCVDISSLYGPFMYSGLPLDHPHIVATANTVDEQLKNTSPIGGVIRYPGDGYFLGKLQYAGNPWIVCSLWLAQYYVDVGRVEEAQELVSWAMARRSASGILSEQFDPETGAALGVAPLVWSHAELINTILDLTS